MITLGMPGARLIQERRTIRQFTEEPVPQELLQHLYNVACWTPNHGLREPWRFIQYSGTARKQFSDAVFGTMTASDKEKYGEQRLKDYMTIPVHLIVVMPEDPRQKQWDEDYGAVCCWIQCFQLAAWEHGLGVVWKTNPYIYIPSFRRAVGVHDGEKAAGVLHIGYPAVIPPARPRTPAESKLTIHCD